MITLKKLLYPSPMSNPCADGVIMGILNSAKTGIEALVVPLNVEPITAETFSSTSS